MKESNNIQQILDLWAEKISQASARNLDAILTRAESVNQALAELAPYGKKARRKLQKMVGLSQSTMAKLEKVGVRVDSFRAMAHNLPPSMSTLYELARMPDATMLSLIAKDIRTLSRSKLLLQSNVGRGSRNVERLLTVLTESKLENLCRHQIIEEIVTAVENIGAGHNIKLIISRGLRESAVAKSPEAIGLQLAA